jgi:hypothetical protein
MKIGQNDMITSLTFANRQLDGVYYPWTGAKITLKTSFGTTVVKLGADCYELNLAVDNTGAFNFAENSGSYCKVAKLGYLDADIMAATSTVKFQSFIYSENNTPNSQCIQYVLPTDVWMFSTTPCSASSNDRCVLIYSTLSPLWTLNGASAVSTINKGWYWMTVDNFARSIDVPSGDNFVAVHSSFSIVFTDIFNSALPRQVEYLGALTNAFESGYIMLKSVPFKTI